MADDPRTPPSRKEGGEVATEPSPPVAGASEPSRQGGMIGEGEGGRTAPGGDRPGGMGGEG
ncbi:MAG TPA: hypothetical protein VL460_05480 [Caulobacteraceae bacterium]|jgi:hypothetical protein|nr:hypothetical protein [Caulobacteraceae bacterium]